MAVKGHSFSNEAYVKFSGAAAIDAEALEKEVNSYITVGAEANSFEISPEEFEDLYY